MKAESLLLWVITTALSALLVGCVPGEEKIDVKTSEIVKAVNGGIGWANVTISVSNVYENVALSAYPETALNLRCGEIRYPCNPSEEDLSATNRLADTLGYVVRRLNERLPAFFCKDESVRLSVATLGTNAVLRLDASLKVPIGKRSVLEAADLPRVMQLAINERRWSISCAPSTSAASRFATVATLLQRNLSALGYCRNGKSKEGPPSVMLELLLCALLDASFADSVIINQDADVKSSYALNVRAEKKDGAALSHLWISGEGLMSDWERDVRKKLVPKNATEVAFTSDEHRGGVSCMFAKVSCRTSESDLLALAADNGYSVSTNGNVISCGEVFRNNGGYRLNYHRDTHVLDGSYSHH